MSSVGPTRVIFFFQLTYQHVGGKLFHMEDCETGLLANIFSARWGEAACRKKPRQRVVKGILMPVVRPSIL